MATPNVRPRSVQWYPSGERSTRPASRSSFSRLFSRVGESSPLAACRARNLSGPARSSQTIRRSHRRDMRSNSAMIGRPVFEPRTLYPGRGVLLRLRLGCAAMLKLREPRGKGLQRQVQAVGEIGHHPVEAAKEQNFQYLLVIIVRAKRLKLGRAERRALVQRISGCDEGLLSRCPAGRAGGPTHNGRDLFVGEVRPLAVNGDMHAPFILASRPGRGPIDHDLSLP